MAQRQLGVGLVTEKWRRLSDEQLQWLANNLVELLRDLLLFVATVSEIESERRERIKMSRLRYHYNSVIDRSYCSDTTDSGPYWPLPVRIPFSPL